MSRRLWQGGAVAIAIAATALLWFRSGQETPEPKPERAARSSDAASVAAREPSDDDARRRDAVERIPPAADSDASAAGAELGDGQLGKGWEGVDLDAVRAALPDNWYWKYGAPTDDEAVVAQRAAERERWNVEYGKILSGTGSEEEIRAYYDQRARLSGDYVEFATYVIDHYGEQLPERDVELLRLARRLHLARLEEMPRKIQEAIERKQVQDAAREAWLADEAAFGGASPED